MVCIDGVLYGIEGLPIIEPPPQALEESTSNLYEENHRAYTTHVQRKKSAHASRGTRKRSTRSIATEDINMPLQTLEPPQLAITDDFISSMASEILTEQDNEDTSADAHLLEMVKRRRLAEGGIMGRIDASWVDEPPKSKKKKKHPSLYVPATSQWHIDFGTVRLPSDPVHPDPSECFGCGYEDTDSQATVVYAEKWNRLLTKFTECCANSCAPSVMARDLHDLFVKDFVAQMIADRVDNASTAAISWSPYKLLYHFFFHNRDTNISASNKLAWIHELQRTIVENQLYKESKVTGRRVARDSGMKKLDMAFKMELPWIKVNPNEMAFSTQSRRINPTSVSLLSSRVRTVQAVAEQRRAVRNPWAPR